MIYSVSVCDCGYRLFNLNDPRGATRADIKALRSYAKEVKCHFGIGLKKCPKCGGEIGSAKEPLVADSPVAAERAATQTFDLLRGAPFA